MQNKFIVVFLALLLIGVIGLALSQTELKQKITW